MKWLDRDNIALLVVLKHQELNQLICFANTHILFNPKRGDIKLGQIKLLLDHLSQLKEKYRDLIIFICGGKKKNQFLL